MSCSLNLALVMRLVVRTASMTLFLSLHIPAHGVKRIKASIGKLVGRVKDTGILEA